MPGGSLEWGDLEKLFEEEMHFSRSPLGIGKPMKAQMRLTYNPIKRISKLLLKAKKKWNSQIVNPD